MSNDMSQAQVIGRPRMKSWDEYEAGCLDTFGGGHRTDGHLEAFHHGMSTVFNLLRSEFPPAEQCKAAPALYEACKQWVDYFDRMIANGKDDPFVQHTIANHRLRIDATRAALASASPETPTPTKE